MAKYTAIIADDEPLLRFHLQKMLTDICHDIEIVAHCENGQQALQAIDELNPDFLFLDIKMPELDGMEVAKKLASMKQAPLIAFITAYDEFAVKAFENNAVDYLLKPISENRLIKTCDKLKLQKKQTPTNDNSGAVLTDLLQQIQQLSSNAQPDYLVWVKAFKGEDLHLIAINDVLFFKAEDKYISVFAQSQGTLNEYIIRSSLKELQQKLDSEQFWQIHRSCIVNVSKIDKVKKDLLGHMKVHIQTHKLPVSRSGQSLFKGM
ncbi:DNA-binding response regulator [Psychromonas sp. psych-6C06]|uniref:LytR/AlgR family response regulator transcription factor n=1 Tax=Psychromonas sp. psych-6C06 TaxID=2058089 RepID=UPI000C33E120|nr:LytTR family DNA-binding domain-containing protein [Psychromonas sp. psych-6C06]PKF63754.1 DNA-binding response regulator [Psychromonas sp. psych-6C06]